MILLQGPLEHLAAAKPGLRALVTEHFPLAPVPKELLEPHEGPHEEPPAAEEVVEDSPPALAAKALRRAYGTRSASALRVALGAAYSAGAEAAVLREAEGWLKVGR